MYINSGGDAVENHNTALLTAGMQFNFSGSAWERIRTPKVFKTISAVTITNETTVWTPAAGKKFRLMGFALSAGTAAGNITVRDGSAGSTVLIIPKMPADTPLTANFGNGILSAAVNNVLTVQGASTETLSGTIWGTEE
jgi:hypothetical protein